MKKLLALAIVLVVGMTGLAQADAKGKGSSIPAGALACGSYFSEADYLLAVTQGDLNSAVFLLTSLPDISSTTATIVALADIAIWQGADPSFLFMSECYSNGNGNLTMVINQATANGQCPPGSRCW